jgi:hypothetical protein
MKAGYVESQGVNNPVNDGVNKGVNKGVNNAWLFANSSESHGHGMFSRRSLPGQLPSGLLHARAAHTVVGHGWTSN